MESYAGHQKEAIGIFSVNLAIYLAVGQIFGLQNPYMAVL